MAGCLGDQRGATFIALAEHLEEQSDPTAVNGTYPSSSTISSLTGLEVFFAVRAAAFITCVHEFMHESGGRGERTLWFFWQAASPQCQADVGFAGAGWPERRWQFFRFSIHSQRASSRTQRFIDEGWALKSESVEALGLWKARRRIRRSIRLAHKSLRHAEGLHGRGETHHAKALTARWLGAGAGRRAGDRSARRYRSGPGCDKAAQFGTGGRTTGEAHKTA